MSFKYSVKQLTVLNNCRQFIFELADFPAAPKQLNGRSYSDTVTWAELLRVCYMGGAISNWYTTLCQLVAFSSPCSLNPNATFSSLPIQLLPLSICVLTQIDTRWSIIMYNSVFNICAKCRPGVDNCYLEWAKSKLFGLDLFQFIL